jgi:hypothetical protein
MDLDRLRYLAAEGDITEGEGIATRRDLARMLAAIYCGCDYSITPRET